MATTRKADPNVEPTPPCMREWWVCDHVNDFMSLDELNRQVLGYAHNPYFMYTQEAQDQLAEVIQSGAQPDCIDLDAIRDFLSVIMADFILHPMANPILWSSLWWHDYNVEVARAYRRQWDRYEKERRPYEDRAEQHILF